MSIGTNVLFLSPTTSLLWRTQNLKPRQSPSYRDYFYRCRHHRCVHDYRYHYNKWSSLSSSSTSSVLVIIIIFLITFVCFLRDRQVVHHNFLNGKRPCSTVLTSHLECLAKVLLQNQYVRLCVHVGVKTFWKFHVATCQTTSKNYTLSACRTFSTIIFPHSTNQIMASSLPLPLSMLKRPNDFVFRWAKIFPCFPFNCSS